MTATPASGRRHLRPWNIPGRAAFHLAHRVAHRGLIVVWRYRRWRLIAGIRLQAWWHRSTVAVEVAGDLRVGRRLRVSVETNTAGRMRVGPGGRWGDGVRIDLRGGELVFGEKVDIRQYCVLQVKGRLELVGPNLIQHGCTLHCDERVTIGDHAVLSEYVTVVDSSHRHDGKAGWFLHDLRTSPVNIGSEVWVAAKATIARGTDIGKAAVVGANSVVVGVVAPGSLVSGVPARMVRQRSPVKPCETTPGAGPPLEFPELPRTPRPEAGS
jgi:acetyltransferase-like isoleucine patch superfamily enzyme